MSHVHTDLVDGSFGTVKSNFAVSKHLEWLVAGMSTDIRPHQSQGSQ